MYRYDMKTNARARNHIRSTKINSTMGKTMNEKNESELLDFYSWFNFLADVRF